MSVTFENLRITKIVIHEIFAREQSDAPKQPVYGAELLKLTRQGLETLGERLVTVLSSNSHCVEMDIVDASDQGVPEKAMRLISLPDSVFIEESHFFADKLASVQTSRQIPGGIVVVAIGQVGLENDSCCLILKAEVHSGFNKRENRGVISAEYLTNLFLTPQQKLYKVGLFIFKASTTIAYVYDQNMARNESTTAAKYFYSAFLGCEIAKSSKSLTRGFFQSTRDYINNLSVDIEQKLDLQDQLNGYLKNKNNATISSRVFADEFLPVENRDDYAVFMQDANFPTTAVMKDLSLIATKLKRRVMNFSTGVKITRKDGSLGDVVEVVESTSDSTKLMIHGKLEDQKV